MLAPAESRAWDAEGHMIVALVADRLLQTQESPEQKKLAELLASDKSNSWTKTDIAGEATWAVRHDKVALRKIGFKQPRPDKGVFRQTCPPVDGIG